MNIWNGKKENKKFPIETEDIYETEQNENIFLDIVKAKGTEVQLFLLGGIKLTGQIVSSDDYTIIMKNKNHSMQMVYKHAISTISEMQVDNKHNNY